MSNLKRSKSSNSLIPRLTISRASIEGQSGQQRGRSIITSDAKPRRSNSCASGFKASADSRYSYNRLSRQSATPMRDSTQRTPLARSSSKKDTRPINEKHWQQEQYLKVKEYFFNFPEIANNIKPPSTQTFVGAMNMLFKQLDPRINITLENYKEQIPSYMKCFGYVTTVQLSTLKCPNTKHAWPQVIAIMSWLVDFVSCIGDAESQEVQGELGREELLCEAAKEYLSKSFLLWNAEKDEAEADREFEKCVCTVLELNPEEYQDKENEIKSLQQKLEDQVITRNGIAEKICSVELEIERKQKEIDDFKQNICEKTWREKCCELKEDIAHLEKITLMKKQNVEELKEVISKQPCSFEDYEVLKNTVETMKSRLHLLQEKNDYWVELLENINYEIHKIDEQINLAIHNFNLAVMKWEEFDPKLRTLEFQIANKMQIREEIVRVKNLIGNYSNQFADELTAAKEKVSVCAQTQKQMMDTLDILKKNLVKTKQKKQQINVDLSRYDCESEMEVKFLSEKLDKEVEDYKALTSQKAKVSDDITSQKHKLEMLDKRIGAKQKELVKIQKEMVNFFVNLHNSMVTTFERIQEMQKLLNDKLDDVVRNKVGQKERELQHLQKLYSAFKSISGESLGQKLGK